MRTYFKIFLLALISCCSFASFAGNPTAYLNFATYTTPDGKNYFETYVSVVGSSLNFVKNSNNKFMGRAHVTISFKLNDSIVASSNYNLTSPEVTDTAINKPDFVNAQRFVLKKGNYMLYFTVDDPNDATHKIISGKQPVYCGYRSDSVAVSDAEFLSSYSPSNKPGPYTKCGYYMVPYVFKYFPEKVKKLSLYCEIYNTYKFTAPHEKVLIKYSVVDEGNYFLNYIKTFSSSVTMDADTVIPFLAQVPIDNLPSGKYSFSISVLDKNNAILAKRKFEFTKDNPSVKATQIPYGLEPYFANRDTLVESIRCLAPTASNNEQEYINSDSLRWANISDLKRFFYFFWKSRDSIHPVEAWRTYLGKVMTVNNSFSAPNIKGYKTDRGRVYLQYGPPNQRVVEKMNPATYPHEIWEYYRLADGQTDVKFVFYSTAVEINNYVLLHSTANSEIHNPHWQYALYSNAGTLLPNDLDQTTYQDQLGEDVNDEFNNPH